MKKIIFIISILVLSFSFAGCGKKKEDNSANEFKTELESFNTKITQIGNNIDSIDTTSSDSKTLLLTYIDEMNTEFQNFKSIEVPDEYPTISTLIVQAADYMIQAQSLFHQAYEAENFDSTVEESARIQYTRAMNCISNIGKVLNGEEIEE